MTVEQAVVERLEDVSAVTAIVSTRIWLDKLPQGPTLPALRVQLVGDERGQHLRGPEGTRRARVQVDAYVADVGDAYTTATALADAVDGDGLGPNASGLLGWKGLVGSPSVEIVGVFYAAERRRMYEADELRLLRMLLDYYVWYRA